MKRIVLISIILILWIFSQFNGYFYRYDRQIYKPDIVNAYVLPLTLEPIKFVVPVFEGASGLRLYLSEDASSSGKIEIEILSDDSSEAIIYELDSKMISDSPGIALDLVSAVLINQILHVEISSNTSTSGIYMSDMTLRDAFSPRMVGGEYYGSPLIEVLYDHGAPFHISQMSLKQKIWFLIENSSNRYGEWVVISVLFGVLTDFGLIAYVIAVSLYLIKE